MSSDYFPPLSPNSKEEPYESSFEKSDQSPPTLQNPQAYKKIQDAFENLQQVESPKKFQAVLLPYNVDTLSREDQQLADFYQGTGPDSDGRGIEDILKWSEEIGNSKSILHESLEYTHNYIQWLFPLEEPSQYNPDAPILTGPSISFLKRNPKCQENITRSFDMMLEFYGLQYDQEINEVTARESFPERKENWMNRENHNYLRISRILTSLRLLGQENRSTAFFNFLNNLFLGDISAVKKIGSSIHHWKKAAGK